MTESYRTITGDTAGAGMASAAAAAVAEGAFCSLEPDNGSDKPPC